MTDKPAPDELARLQKNCGIPHLPTPLTYDLRRAISGEGPRAYDWEDKPHRLVFDACREIEATAREVEALRGEAARLREALKFYANTPCNMEFGVVNVCPYDDGDIARAALGEKQ